MNDDNFRTLQELLKAQAADEAVALATIVRARGSVPRHEGTKMLIYADGRTTGTIGGGEMESRVLAEAAAALQDGRSRLLPYSLVDPGQGDPGVCGGELEIFIEPYAAPVTVLIIGCGHVGRSLAYLAKWLGYRVIVTDDREALASPEHIPEADIHLPGNFADVLAQQAVTANTFIVLVTRNVMVDRQIIPLLVDVPAPYIGIMGSKRRWAETRRLLLADGVAAAALDKFHSPLGLELNAESPEEIAVSIMSEIIMLRRDGTGQRMSD